MINLGDFVITNNYFGGDYSFLEPALVIAKRETVNWCLVINPRCYSLYLCEDLSKTMDRDGFKYNDIMWIDDIKVINPHGKVIWYSERYLEKVPLIILPNGQSLYRKITPKFGIMFYLENICYEIVEMSEDKSIMWAELVEE